MYLDIPNGGESPGTNNWAHKIKKRIKAQDNNIGYCFSNPGHRLWENSNTSLSRYRTEIDLLLEE